MVRFCLFLSSLLFSWSAFAAPSSPHYVTRYYHQFLASGVSPQPLKDSLLYIMNNWNKPLESQGKKGKKVSVKITNPRFLGIIDFNKSSLEKRFWILDLQSGTVKSHWVSHGAKTGGLFAYQFSNQLDSNKTSLGFYLTGSFYKGKYGKSMKLFGLDETNDQAFDRDIVLHPASYVSYRFAYQNLRIGRSYGCFAVSHDSLQEILNSLPPGSLIYAYHDQLRNMDSKIQVPADDDIELTEEERI